MVPLRPQPNPSASSKNYILNFEMRFGFQVLCMGKAGGVQFIKPVGGVLAESQVLESRRWDPFGSKGVGGYRSSSPFHSKTFVPGGRAHQERNSLP